MSWEPKAIAHVERGPYNKPNIGSSDFNADAAAAYIRALCWVLSGQTAPAEKAAQTVDAWSGTLKSISNRDARLLVGMSGCKFCIAGEVLKRTWDGWLFPCQKRFESVLRDICYSIIQDFCPSANGNWDASRL